MENISSQIKINLPLPLKSLIQKKANKYGLTLAMYTKYLMISDLEKSEKPSQKTLKALKLAKKQKFTKVDNTKNFFDKL
jgi:hypothetical protein